MCPRFSISFASSKEEGAGKSGCALHPRSHVQCASKESAHEHTGEAENTPAFPAQWLYGLYRALPGESELLATIAPGRRLASQGLDASNPGVRTTRLRRTLQHRSSARKKRATTLPRPPQPVPTSVTTADVPSCGTGCPQEAGDLGQKKTNYFYKGDWTAQISMKSLGNFDFWRKWILRSEKTSPWGWNHVETA
jgi:hypothetical protein